MKGDDSNFKMTKKEMKKEAIKRMKILRLHQNAIEDFINENKLNKSDGPLGSLYWLDEEEQKMIKEFEEEHKVIVYHVIHTFSNLGETYELLFVSNYKEEWEDEKVDLKNGFACVYVKVIDNEQDSEMGYIGVEYRNGGLIRVC